MAGTTRPEGDRKLARRGTPALLGAAIYVTTLRPLLGRDPLTIILATFGISLVLQNYALWQFGPVARKIQEPFTGHFTLFYLDYPWYRLVIALLSAAIIGALWLFLKFGTYGIWIRATTQDRVMAQAMGIPVPSVLTVVFAIGAGLAAASGVLFGPLVGVNHAMGLDWVLKAFIVVVVGGMGNLGGSIAASIFIGLLESYASLWVSPARRHLTSIQYSTRSKDTEKLAVHSAKRKLLTLWRKRKCGTTARYSRGRSVSEIRTPACQGRFQRHTTISTGTRPPTCFPKTTSGNMKRCRGRYLFGTRESDRSKEAMNDAAIAEQEIVEELVGTEPTTIAGVLALLRFQRDYSEGRDFLDDYLAALLMESVETGLLNLQTGRQIPHNISQQFHALTPIFSLRIRCYHLSRPLWKLKLALPVMSGGPLRAAGAHMVQ